MIIHGINLQLGNYSPLTQRECEEPKFSESLKLRLGTFVFLNQSDGKVFGKKMWTNVTARPVDPAHL